MTTYAKISVFAKKILVSNVEIPLKRSKEFETSVNI